MNDDNQDGGAGMFCTPSDSMRIVVKAVYKLGGNANYAVEGADRRAVLQEFIAELNLTTEQQKEVVGGSGRHRNRHRLSYTAIRGAHEGRERAGYLRKGSPRGVWELTAKGMEYGKRLVDEGQSKGYQ